MSAVSNPARSVILVAHDFTEESRRAMAFAWDLAKKTSGADVHVVHCVTALPEVEPMGGFFGGSSVASILVEARARLEADCERFAKDLGVPCHGHIRVGSPAPVISEVAAALGADILVLGTHGRRGLARALLGSVAESVLRTAPCAVLIARPKEPSSVPAIEPPCPDCVATRAETKGASFWCARHAAHHPRPHTYSELPSSFAVGSMNLRFDP